MNFRLTPALTSVVLLLLNIQQTSSSPTISYDDEYASRIPTPQESAVLARRILHLTPIGTFSTIFQPMSSLNLSSNQLSYERATLHADGQFPQELVNTPIGLMEYVADCEASGNPTVLAISIATTFKNVAAGSNASLSLSWTPPRALSHQYFTRAQRHEYSAANLPRFSLSGYFEQIETDDIKRLVIDKCFVKLHPDARNWLPGNKIHESSWKRFVVQHIYWVGGFGDRAYIGWIPLEMWKNVRWQDIARVRLPGEKKRWKEIFDEWL